MNTPEDPALELTRNEQPPEGFEADDLFDPQGRLDQPRSRSRKKKRRLPAHLRTPEPFLEQPRPQRRAQRVSLGWKIRCDPNGMGVFTSRDVLPGSREWPLQEGETPTAQWADAYFVSAKHPRRAGIFYNATIETAARPAVERVVSAAEDAVQARMTPEQQNAARGRVWSRRTPAGREMRFAPRPAVPALGGLTVPGAQAQWLRENWEHLATLAAPTQMAVIDPRYGYGLGVRLVLPVPGLSVAAVAAAIREFWAKGEPEHWEQALPYAQVQADIERLLRVHLLRWDRQHAQALGLEPPEWPADLAEVSDYESVSIRMP